MSEYGYVKLSRKAYAECPFWNEPRPFSRWEAWEDLIQSAAYKDHRRVVGGQVVDLQRGEILASLRFLAERWGWGLKRVRIFISLLLEMDRIRAQREAQGGTVYLLVNYDAYQSEGTAEGTEEGTPRAHRGHKEKTSKKENTIPASQEKPDEPPEEKPKRTPAPRAHRLPDDWEPTPEHAAYCEREDIDMDAEATKFRFHAEANGRKQQKWNAAFSTWLRSEIPKARRGSRRPGRPEYITRTG